MDTLHRIMVVNLNAAQSMETDMVVDLQLTDIRKNDRTAPDTYRLQVRKRILEVNPPSSSHGQFLIITDSVNQERPTRPAVLGPWAVSPGVRRE